MRIIDVRTRKLPTRGYSKKFSNSEDIMFQVYFVQLTRGFLIFSLFLLHSGRFSLLQRDSLRFAYPTRRKRFVMSTFFRILSTLYRFGLLLTLMHFLSECLSFHSYYWHSFLSNRLFSYLHLMVMEDSSESRELDTRSLVLSSLYAGAIYRNNILSISGFYLKLLELNS